MPRGEKHGGKPIQSGSKLNGYQLKEKVKAAKDKATKSNNVAGLKAAFEDLSDLVEALIEHHPTMKGEHE